jgi:MFS family permease
MIDEQLTSATDTINWLSVSAAIISVSVVGVTIGLGLPLLSTVMENRGYSASLIGMNSAMAGVASLMTCPFATPIAARLGVAQSLVIAILAVALAFVGFFQFESFGIWLVLRTLLGFGLTMVFILSEFWISTAAPAAKRGFVLGLYATVLCLGYALGPFILSQVGSAGFAPFGWAIAATLTGILPIVAAWNLSPKIASTARVAFLPYVTKVPTATGAVLLYGAVETGIYALMPVYGELSGYDEHSTALMMIYLGLGNLVFQIPLGLLSDRLVDRRKLLAAIAAVGLLAMGLLVVFSGNWWLTAALLFVWGGMITGLYTVGLAHLGSKLSGCELASANSAFILCYAIGMIIGPQLIGIGMDYAGPNGFAAVLAAFFAIYLALVASRITNSQMRA